ncbi:MAG: HNH endonuclease [Chloroflexi bacterium]|nr:HNH endonuclease [Chloroflexota bacterium]
MSPGYISAKLRARVRAQAQHRCGYCLTPEVLVGMEMEIDHIIPLSLGGSDEESNLWLACPQCNRHKGDQVSVVDPVTLELVHIFNPREQKWDEHFTWSLSGEYILGLTPVGRATVSALQLNRAILVEARRFWAQVGRHPATF